MPFILYEKGQKAVFSSSLSPGENREKKDEDLVGGQRNLRVKITIRKLLKGFQHSRNLHESPMKW